MRSVEFGLRNQNQDECHGITDWFQFHIPHSEFHTPHSYLPLINSSTNFASIAGSFFSMI
jgi:hypothetical protein